MKTLILIIALVFLVGCEQQLTSYEMVEKGSYSGITENKQIVITEQAEWDDLWKEIKKIQTPMPETPTIDFSKEMIIAVFMGEKTTGGYIIEITKTEKNTVYYKENQPKEGMMVTQALTQPYYIAKTNKIKGEIVFLKIN